jgi:hypothetical protein
MHEVVAGRGLSYRVVLDRSLDRLVARSGAEIRLASAVPANLALADRAAALLPLEHSALIVRPGHLFDALHTLFNAVWAGAPPTPPDAPTGGSTGARAMANGSASRRVGPRSLPRSRRSCGPTRTVAFWRPTSAARTAPSMADAVGCRWPPIPSPPAGCVASKRCDRRGA